MPSPVYYVRATKGAGAHTVYRPLLGPFQRPREAGLMLEPVKRACARHGLYNGCTFTVWRCRDSKPPKGKLQLSIVADSEWLSDVIEASKTWPDALSSVSIKP